MKPKVINIALDITDIVVASLAMPGMQAIYPYYPLKDMIYDILSPPVSPGEIEKFYDKLLTYTPGSIDNYQHDIDLFIERVCFDVDESLELVVGNIYSSYIYSMKGWLNSSSILLEVKESNDTNSIISGFEFGE